MSRKALGLILLAIAAGAFGAMAGLGAAVLELAWTHPHCTIHTLVTGWHLWRGPCG